MEYKKGVIVPKSFPVEDIVKFEEENLVKIGYCHFNILERGFFKYMAIRLDPKYDWYVIQDSDGEILAVPTLKK